MMLTVSFFFFFREFKTFFMFKCTDDLAAMSGVLNRTELGRSFISSVIQISEYWKKRLQD